MLLGIVIVAFANDSITETEVDWQLEQAARTTDKMTTDEWDVKQTDSLLDPDTWGSGTGMGRHIIKQVFWNGLISLPKMQTFNFIEFIFVIFATLIRAWLYVMLAIEGYRLIKNKT